MSRHFIDDNPDSWARPKTVLILFTTFLVVSNRSNAPVYVIYITFTRRNWRRGGDLNFRKI